MWDARELSFRAVLRSSNSLQDTEIPLESIQTPCLLVLFTLWVAIYGWVGVLADFTVLAG